MKDKRKWIVWMRLTAILVVTGVLIGMTSCASSSGYHKRPPSGKFKCK